MNSTLPSVSSCCDPTCQPVTIDIPGSPGTPGAPGAAGANGQNAYTLTGAAFTMPAEGAIAPSLLVGNSAFMAVGEFVFLQTIGTLQVTAIVDGTHVTLKNPKNTGTGEYQFNAAPGTVAGIGTRLVPAGQQGPSGSAGSVPTFNSISPTTTKGDLIVDNGLNNPTASDVRQAAGANGTVLVSDSAQITGRKDVAITPNAATDNIVPRFDASGNTTPTPLQASGILVTDDGAIQSTPTGGNTRGSKAVDLQVDRAVATQVASGDNSVVAGGLNNTASASKSSVGGGSANVASATSASVSGGIRNTATGIESHVGGGADNASGGANSAVAGGSGNIISGVGSFIGAGSGNEVQGLSSSIAGGSGNIIFGDYSFAVGSNNSTSASASYASVIGGKDAAAVLYGQIAHSAGKFAANGDAQTSELIWRGATTDATPTEIFLNGATLRAVISNNTTWAFNILAVARKDDGTSITFEVKGGLKNTGGTVVLVAAVTAAVIADGTGGALTIANFTVSADDPNNSLKILVTGIAAQNWRWVGHARLVEVEF